jgi:hypothetical protein
MDLKHSLKHAEFSTATDSPIGSPTGSHTKSFVLVSFFTGQYSILCYDGHISDTLLNGTINR